MKLTLENGVKHTSKKFPHLVSHTLMYSLRHGLGLLLLGDNTVYFGQWNHGYVEGYGVLIHKDEYNVSHKNLFYIVCVS